jgi:hypothetical protein
MSADPGTRRVAPLGDVIQEALASWSQTPVELAIFETAEPAAIAHVFERFCREQLGVGVRGALFYQSSIGAVAGLELEDGRRVVLKAYQPDRTRERLEEVVRLQSYLSRHGGLAAAVLAGPEPLASGWGVVEHYVEHGRTRDGHTLAVRNALAVSLHAISAQLASFVEASRLTSQLFSQLAPGALWPKPHSKIFDFEATQAGAEEIDALGTLALQRMTPAGRLVLGHCDWRAEHVRFEGDQPVAAFDWDSLCKEREPTLVGFIAHAFCADWTRSDYAQAPTLDEARAFVAAYEAARGAPFERDERALCGAAFAYSVGYTSRCGHAFGKRERDVPGTFHHLLASHGEGLLEL